jgi:hypothetical protein
MVTPVTNWSRTHIEPWWSVNDHRGLLYSNEEFNDDASLTHWKSLGYTQTKFTGDMYDMRNPEPTWMNKFRCHYNWEHFSWSVYRMGPGTVLPNHSDLYLKFREVYNITDPTKIFRAIVFLEDWQSGHYSEIDGTPIVGWRAGDTVAWRWDTLHAAANVGYTDRYTLQITGLYNENFIL